MSQRWDETWHRLREWTNGQGPSERMSAQILLYSDYKELDPSHPLGGKDGGKDALCRKRDELWIMACYFPRGQQSFNDIRGKFLEDLQGVGKNGACGMAFVCNQELKINERKSLREEAGGLGTHVDLFHLERVTCVLDHPYMAGVRRQFLNIDFDPSISTLLNLLVAAGRDENEIREAIVRLPDFKAQLLARGAGPNGRCDECGSVEVYERHVSIGDEVMSTTDCDECGAHLGDCV